MPFVLCTKKPPFNLSTKQLFVVIFPLNKPSVALTLEAKVAASENVFAPAIVWLPVNLTF